MFRKVKGLCLLIGGYQISKGLYGLGEGINNYYIKTPVNLKEKYGNGFALITQATDELGKEFANELSKQGFNLILIGKNNEKLLKIKQEIASQNEGKNLEINLIQKDLANPDNSEKLLEELKSKEISIVVNNVQKIPKSQYFVDMDLEKIKLTMDKNMLPFAIIGNHYSQVFNSKADNEKKTKSAIIHIGSSMGETKNPLQSIFSSTSAYINNYTNSLQFTKNNEKLDILLVSPWLLKTKRYEKVFGLSQERRDPFGIDWWAVDTKTIVQNTLKNVGSAEWIVGSPAQGFLLWLNKHSQKFEELQCTFSSLYLNHLQKSSN